MHIRPASIADAAQIADFNCRLAAESEDKHLDPATVLAGVEALLADSRHGRYFLAVDEPGVAGQLLITYEWSDWRNGQFWWIQSVYVAPDFRRRGVFSALLAHVRSLAQSRSDVCGLRLYVDNDNARAIAAYEARGLAPTSYSVMELELG
jgi:GNAT superfamily N-acetyltransferase